MDTSVNTNRLVWADSLKGWLIVLVVLGHAIQNVLGAHCESSRLWNMIYSFHMPAFMAVSGYLGFNSINRKGEGRNKWMPLILRRLQQLIIPFVIWTLILLASDAGLSWTNIKEYFLYPDKGLWFLWVLFIVNVLFILGTWLSEKSRIRHEFVIICLCLLLAGIMLLFDLRILGFQFIAYYFLFYTLGFYLHKYSDKVMTGSVALILLLVAVWGALAWFWRMHELPSFLAGLPLPAALVQYAYRFLAASVAVYVLLAAAPKALDRKTWLNAPFVGLGALSLGIYTAHIVLMKHLVRLFSGLIVNQIALVACSFAAALLLSWLIVFLLNKWKVTSRFLLGKI